MTDRLDPVRRVVTGHDGERPGRDSRGRPPPPASRSTASRGPSSTRSGRRLRCPPRSTTAPTRLLGPLQLAPPAGGTRIRIVDIPPDTAQNAIAPDAAAAAFDAIGATHAHTLDGPHALMHRTETVDYGILLSGEIWLVVDDGEARLLPGDVVVQRGTNHAWSNRTDETARMAFVLVDGRFADELRRPTEGDDVMPIVLQATWARAKARRTSSLDALEQLSPLSRAEPGCRFYQAYRDPAEPRVVPHLRDLRRRGSGRGARRVASTSGHMPSGRPCPPLAHVSGDVLRDARRLAASSAPRIRFGQMPCLPGIRMPFGSRASLIVSASRRPA